MEIGLKLLVWKKLARGLGQPSIEAVPGTSADAPETLPSTERLD